LLELKRKFLMENDEIKRQRMEELKKRQLEEEKQEETEAKIALIIRSLLTDEARNRLNNVKIVNQQLYLKTVQTILYFQNGGQLKEKIGEEELKMLLEKLRNKKEIKITRK